MINNKGSASVFLVFLFVILLAAVGVLLECSRYRGARTISEDITESAAKAVMTKYYRPLYDDYHLFFMAFEEGEDESAFIEKQSKDYMQDSLEPAGDRKGSYNIIPFAIPQLKALQVSNLEFAVDKDSKIFQQEAIAYMKYKSIDKVLQKFGVVFDSVQSLKESTKIVKEKMKCEESISVSAVNFLELMQLVDGVTFDVAGEKQGSSQISVRSDFVKKLVIGKPSMNSVGIHNQKLWTKLKNNYIDVFGLLRKIESECVEIESIERDYEELEVKLNNIEKGDKKGKRGIEQNIRELEDRKDECLSKAKSNCRLYAKTVKDAEQKTEEALNLIKKLRNNMNGLEDKLNQYKEKLNSKQGELSQDLYQGLSEDVKDMESVCGTGKEGIHLDAMYDSLEANLLILKNAQGLDVIDISASGSNLRELKTEAVRVQSLFTSYQISSIQFNYPETTGGEEKDNPIKALKKLLSGKISELVIPEGEKLSESELSEEDILNYSDDRAEEISLQKVMSGLDLSKNVSGIFNLFKEGEGENGDIIKNVSDSVLLLFYEEEHFKSFLERKEKEDEATHLFYELEYLLGGSTLDNENMESVINKLMLWRTAFNFISIMCDEEKKNAARNTAIVLAGITGLEPVIQVTQTLILLTWAFDEALVDVAALLKDKEIKIIKSGKDFCIKYEDLLDINQKKIQEKASQLKEQSAGLSYKSFLEILLFLDKGGEQYYRCMDIINANIGIRYCEEFNLKNCLYSFKLTTDMYMNSKFLILQKANQVMVEHDNAWSIHAEYQGSY